MVDHERFILDGGIWDIALAGYLMARDLEGGKAGEAEAGHDNFLGKESNSLIARTAI